MEKNRLSLKKLSITPKIVNEFCSTLGHWKGHRNLVDKVKKISSLIWVDAAWADVLPRLHVKITFFTYFPHCWWNDWSYHNQPHNFLNQNFISSLFMVSYSWYGFVLDKVAAFFVIITSNCSTLLVGVITPGNPHLIK